MQHPDDRTGARGDELAGTPEAPSSLPHSEIESLAVPSAVRRRASAFAAGVGPPVIDGYRVLTLIGRGAYGDVYLAEQLNPKRTVAVKVLRHSDASVIARFDRERQILAEMRHPGIAAIFDAGFTSAQQPFFAMELVPGGVTLTDYCQKHLPRSGPDGLRRRLELFEQVCEAVWHAHQRGVLHRDLKPQNILVSDRAISTPEPASGKGDARPSAEKPQAKVIDFGVSKAIEGASDQELRLTMTSAAEAVGTPLYMSPEQAAGQRDLSVRSDVYSLGAILYELLTGAVPVGREHFRRNGGVLDLSAVVSQTPRSIEELHREHAAPLLDGLTPWRVRELRWITEAALQKDPTVRVADAKVLSSAVRAFLDGREVPLGPAPLAYRARAFVKRRKLALTVAASILVSLLAAIAVLLVSLDAKERALTQTQTVALRTAVDRGNWQAAIDAAHAIERRRATLGVDDSIRLFEALDALDQIGELRTRLGGLLSAQGSAPDPALLLWQADLELAQAVRGAPVVEPYAQIERALAAQVRPLDEADRAYARGLLAPNWGAALAEYRAAIAHRPSHRRAIMMAAVAALFLDDKDAYQEVLPRWELIAPEDWQLRVARVAYATFYDSKPELERRLQELRLHRKDGADVELLAAVSSFLHTAINSEMSLLGVDSPEMQEGAAKLVVMSMTLRQGQGLESTGLSLRSSAAMAVSQDVLRTLFGQISLAKPSPEAVEKACDAIGPRLVQLKCYARVGALLEKSDPDCYRQSAAALDQALKARPMPALDRRLRFMRLVISAALSLAGESDPGLPASRVEELFATFRGGWKTNEGADLLFRVLSRLGRTDLAEQLCVVLERSFPTSPEGWNLHLEVLSNRQAHAAAFLVAAKAAETLPPDQAAPFVSSAAALANRPGILDLPGPKGTPGSLREIAARSTSEGIRALARSAPEPAAPAAGSEPPSAEKK